MTTATTFDSSGFTITTTGANDTVGGAVAITTTGQLTTGAITTTGGTDSGTDGGHAAGAISLSGGDVNVGALTATGSAATGGGAAGGAGGAVTVTATDGSPTITLSGDIDTSGGAGNGAGAQGAGGTVTFNDPVILAANRTISTGATAGNIVFNDTLNGTTAGVEDLTLTAGTGSVTFGGVVGGTTRLGDVTVSSAANVTATTFSSATLTQSAGTGTTTFNGAVNTNAAGGVSLTGTNLAVNNTVTTTGGGTVTVNESGTANFAAAGDISADGAVSLTATGGISAAGDITTTNDNVTYVSAVTLTGPVAVNTGMGAGNIAFNSTVNATTAGVEDLTLTAGTGNVTFSGVVGGTTRVGDVTIASATDVTATTFNAATLTQTAGSGTTTLNGAVNTNAAGGVGLTGTNLAVNNTLTTTGGGTVTVNESGTATFAAAGDISADGAVSLTATGGISTAGDITTTNDNVTYASNTTLTGPVVVNAGSGAVTFTGAVNGAQSLTANSTGTTTFNSAVGNTTALTSLTTNAGGTTAINGGSVTTTGTQTYNDAVTLNAAGNSTTLTGTDITFASTVRSTTDGEDALTLSGTGTTTFNAAVGDSSLRLASLTTNGGGTTTLNGNVTTTGAQTYTDSVRIDTDLTLATTNSAVAFASTLDSQSAEANDLTINTGSGAVTFGGAIGGGSGGAFGALTINNTAAGVILPTTTAQTLNVTTSGAITDTGALTVSGTTTLAAGSANNITLDNANNFGTAVVVTSGNNVALVDTNALNLGAATVSGTLALTAGSHLTQSGVLNVAGTTTITMTSGGTDILLNTQANDLGTNAPVLAGMVSNIRDLAVRNVNAGAKVPVISPGTTNLAGLTGLRNLTLTFNNAPINLPGLTASGTMTISSGGNITDSGPSVVPGLSNLNANGFNIELDDPGNNFGTVQLAGAAITLFNVSSINLAGVQASSSFALQSAGSLTVSSPISSGSAINLGSTGGDLILNANVTGSADVTLAATGGSLAVNSPVDAGGALTLTAGQAYTQSAAGTLTSTGPVIITAGTNAQVAGIATGSSVQITSGGGTTFISPLTLNGPFTTTAGGAITFNDSFASGGTVALTAGGGATFNGQLAVGGQFVSNATGDITFNAPLTGAGILTANTTAVTRFAAPINALGTLVTNAGGSTVIGGGLVDVTGSFTFNDAATLTANTTLSGPTGRFSSTLDGAQALTVNLTGDAVFAGAIGAIQPLTSIVTDTGGRTLYYGGSALTTGAQTYNDAVGLGANTTIGASELTFNGTLNTGPALATLSGLHAASTGESDLIANVAGAVVFNGTVGQPAGQLSRLGDTTLNSVSTAIRANFSSTALTVNSPLVFDPPSAGTITVDTTGAQRYARTVTLGADLTFNSAADSLVEGITFQEELIGADRAITATAPGGAITAVGDIGSESGRFAEVSFAGRNLVVGGDIRTTGNIALAVGTGGSAERNDYLTFTVSGSSGSGPRHTTLDSLNGAIILGSGAEGTGTTAKNAAPLRASIFKSDEGDLYLLAKRIIVQPFERLAVRNGSFVAIADGTGTEDGITLSSTAASNYLVLSTARTDAAPSIHIHSRAPADYAKEDGGQEQDQGTDLVAGVMLFYNALFKGSASIPTRESFSPRSGANAFNYDIVNAPGNLPNDEGSGVIGRVGGNDPVYSGDLNPDNTKFRPQAAGLLHLALDTKGSGYNVTTHVIEPSRFGDPPAAGTGDAMRTVISKGGRDQSTVTQVFVPSGAPVESASAPAETDLAAAVREQLQALGIYARALTPEEKAARERLEAVFVTVPRRARPREADYEVADARVEDRAVREVLRFAEEVGLFGEGQDALADVAQALDTTYFAYKDGAPGDKTLEELVTEYRAWLESHPTPESTKVLGYLRLLHNALRKIELLGLTPQELEVSKAQIYGSVLRAKLNVEPEFLKELVEEVGEGAPLAAKESKAEPAKGNETAPTTKQAAAARSLITAGPSLH
ncbi:MAG: beta strand repeat-containing protein [Verrucomicrobiota bacterium]